MKAHCKAVKSSFQQLVSLEDKGLTGTVIRVNKTRSATTDVAPITGEQRLPYRGFDELGAPFSADAGAHQVEQTASNQPAGMNEALVTSHALVGCLSFAPENRATMATNTTTRGRFGLKNMSAENSSAWRMAA